MIEKMKKFTFLVTDREYEGFIESIRELGVVHVTQLQQGATSTELQEAIYMEQRYARALDFLKIYGTKYALKSDAVAPEYTSPLSLLEKVEELQVQENVLLHEEDELQKEYDMLDPWGDFSPEKVQSLSQTIGMEMHFFRCGSKRFKAEWLDKFYAVPVTEVKKNTYFVTFSESRPEIAAEHLALPQKSLSQVKEEITDVKKRKFVVRQQLSAVANSLLPVLEEGMLEVRNDISLSKVHLSSEKTCGDVLHLMLGWVRADFTAPLTEYLDKAHIYYDMQDPAYEDDVPVQITNGRFSRLFEPILKMYSLPNYNDLDPTQFFAPFFMLFFGLCMGDAGYGLLILLVGMFLSLRGKQDIKSYGHLACWLGGMTVVCGLATGTIFGVSLVDQDWAFLAPVKQYFLSDNGCGPIFGYNPMMVISIIIGFIQVLLGMVLKACKAWKNHGFGYAIGTLSWVVALLSGIAMMAVPSGSSLTFVFYAILAICGAGIFLYNNPSAYKNPILGPLLNIGTGLWDTYGMITGLLGDLLSYIRLFALGLTGGILGFVFNSLAMNLTKDLPWAVRWLPFILLLLFGHGLTFGLSMIGAFVHPMRLTFVEFFKNADFGGGGKEYKPFSKNKN